jgi:succinate dehydrogenase / fumarate reductase, cytochrome b subunit
MSGILNSSIARKFAMALSAFFLMFFLLQHFVINLTSIFPNDGKTFNDLSHFMGTNPLIQYVIQPVLIFGVVFHFVMGFVLEIKNNNARAIKYTKNNGAANSTWMSRNMIWSGLAILAFMILHFIDFWFPEINTKFIQGDWSGIHNGEFRYFEELQHKFLSHVRTIAYVIAFVFLSLHLMHGFNSAFQSVGANNKYTKGLKTFVIALFHHLKQVLS